MKELLSVNSKIENFLGKLEGSAAAGARASSAWFLCARVALKL